MSEFDININSEPPINLTFQSTLEGGGGTSDGLWERNSNNISPKIIANSVSIGSSTLLGSELFRVAGQINTESLKIGRTVISSSGGGSLPVGSILSERNSSDAFTYHKVLNTTKESLGLIRVDGSNNEIESLEYYNDSSTSGIKASKSGSGVYKNYVFEYSDGNNNLPAYSILPKSSSGSTNDTEFRIGKTLSIQNANTYITKDNDGNMILSDAVTGTYTLFELTQGFLLANPANGLTYNTTTKTLGIGLSSTNSIGSLSDSDWNTFNNKVSFPGFGTNHNTAAYGDHNHSGVYQPVGSYLTAESDPVFSGSAAYGISSGDISNWNNKVSFPGFGTSHVTAAYGDHNHDSTYQAVLSSGTNIKTLDGNSLLGSGNIDLGDMAYKGYWSGSQAAYDAIGSKDANTIYFIPVV